MTQLTILTTTKPFTDLFATIQENALASWVSLDPKPEVIVFGDDDGAAQACERLSLIHVPEVATTEQGTPLLSDMFLQGQSLARTPVVCWSNADIIFTDRINALAKLIAAAPSPIYSVGRRIDIELRRPLDLDAGWQDRLLQLASRSGEVKPVNWIDWFAFPRGLFESLPPFVIGRPGYDQWLIWRATQLGATVLDATAYVPAIHQRHDYSHVGGRTVAFRGPEARSNLARIDHWSHYHSIAHARVKLDAQGRVLPATDPLHLFARPRRALAHALRFTVPLRQRLLGETATWRRSSRH